MRILQQVLDIWDPYLSGMDALLKFFPPSP
jgi:hypothetical protein